MQDESELKETRDRSGSHTQRQFEFNSNRNSLILSEELIGEAQSEFEINRSRLNISTTDGSEWDKMSVKNANTPNKIF